VTRRPPFGARVPPAAKLAVGVVEDLAHVDAAGPKLVAGRVTNALVMAAANWRLMGERYAGTPMEKYFRLEQ
jgi:hypothetical protein